MPELTTAILVGLVIFVLFRILEHLKAIRTSLADIAKATHDTAYSTGHLTEIKITTDKTKTLLERAVKKQWGSAIDSIDAR